MGSNEQDPKAGTGTSEASKASPAKGDDAEAAPSLVAKPGSVLHAKLTLDRAQDDLLKAEVGVLVNAKEVTPTFPGVATAVSSKTPRIIAAQQVLTDAQNVVRVAREQLHEARVRELSLPYTEELRRLDTTVPLALLPVRIETRFARDQSRLLVRVYPDEIFADGHEPGLTDVEYEAGESYWRSYADTGREQDGWRALLQRFPRARAAWIAHVTQPRSVAPDGRPRRDEATVPEGIPRRQRSWERALEARCLPDRWSLVLYVGGVRRSPIVGPPIRMPLALSHSPRRDPRATTDALIDADAAWLMDFNAALLVGMAFAVPTDAAMLGSGIDRLLVVGVRSTLDPESSAVELERLFDAHHYHEGLAFVPQGTPTTNTRNFRTGFPAKDPEGSRSFAVERRYGGLREDPATDERSAGRRFARALGVREGLFDRVDGADLTEREAARAMMAALWPATLGHWLEVLMAPLLSGDTQTKVRRYTIDHVQGRGPLAAFRVGRVPYGVLPVTALDVWKPMPGDPEIEAALVNLLQDLMPFWRRALLGAPALSRSGPPGPDGPDPDGNVFRLLTLLPSTSEIRRRVTLGGQFVQQSLERHAASQTPYWREHMALTHAPLRQVRGVAESPRLASFLQANLPQRIDLPLVGSGPERLTDYLTLLRSARADALQRDDVLPPEAERPWLYRLLRHAMLQEFRRVARETLRSVDPSRVEAVEPEVLDVAGFSPSPMEVFREPAPSDSGAAPLGQYLHLSRLREEGHPELGEFDAALGRLQGLELAELERLLSETLDVCSHRIDAWVTAVAMRRIEAMRQRRPRGVVLGAWGWVEGIQFDRSLTAAPGVSGVHRQAETFGHIHGPSMDQAAAAAILRNAYMQRYGAERDGVAIDLSPPRVRGALRLLEGLRQGLPLGALLGQDFERALRDRWRQSVDRRRLDPSAPELNFMRFLDPLRRRFPLTPPVTPAPTEGPREGVIPRDVVDGLALHRGRAQVAEVLEGARPSAEERVGVEAELDRIAASLDAVSDLLTAEAVFQSVKGQAAVAGSSLDALAGGTRPPDPEVIRTPRSGRAVTHRVILRLASPPGASLPLWGTLGSTPRASANRAMELWLDELLGPPDAIGSRVDYEVPVDGRWEPRTRRVTAAHLGLRAVDLLALLREGDPAHPASEFQLRVVASIPDARGHRVELFDRGEGPAAARSWAEAFGLLRLVRGVFTRSRALRPDDLGVPNAAPPGAGIVADPGLDACVTALEALGRRIDAALGASTRTAAELVAAMEALAPLLREASLYGIERAWPAPGGGDARARFDALRAQASSVRAEIQRRLRIGGGDPGVRAKAIFGEDFLLVPTILLADTAALEASFRATDLLEDPEDPHKWLAQSARVRPAVGFLSRLLAVLRTRGLARVPRVAQLPFAPGDRWVGWRTRSGAPSIDVVSLSVIGDVEPTHTWAGLLVDEWPERIPTTEESTGVAFHYNDPGVEAAQAMLLVAPPAPDTPWSIELLERVLWGTLELARMRSVPPDRLDALGQYLPGLFLTENVRNETVSTNLSPHVRGEPSVGEES